MSGWKRLREATAVASAPALLRGDNEPDADDVGGPGDGDADDQACPGCSGEGIKGGDICPTCMGSGSVVREAQAGEATMCSTCLCPDCDLEGDDIQRIREAALTAQARKAIPKGKFAIPSKAPGSGSYPIHDRAHAVAALARSSGKPEEGTVKSAVDKAYPDLRDKTKEAEPFGGNKAPPFGKDAEDDDEKDTKDGKKGKGKDAKTKESSVTLLERIEALESAVARSDQQYRSLREAKPGSMAPTFSTPTRVKTSQGQEGYQVALIREGGGNLSDDQWYTAEAVRELCESGVCEGMQAFGDHPTEKEEEELPERSVKELVGSYHDVKFAESGGKAQAQGIFVPLTLDESHPRYGWVVTLAEAAARNPSSQPICGISLYGLSAGDDGERPDGSFGRMVSLIRPSSADIVTSAGAGGGFIRQLMESARALRNRSNKELTPMKSMAYQSAVREAAKRVREASSDEDRQAAIATLEQLEGETIDNVPDSVEQLREAAPKLVEQMRETLKAEVKDDDGDLKTENEQLRTQLREAHTTIGGFTEALGITEALRDAGVEDAVELRWFAGKAQERGLRESADILEMVRVERAYEESKSAAQIAKLREAFELDDTEIEGAGARIPVSALPSDGGISVLRESGLPTLDAE